MKISTHFTLLLSLLFGLSNGFAPIISTRQPRSHRPHASPNDEDDNMYVEEVSNPGRRNLIINVATAGVLAAAGVSTWSLFQQNVYTPDGFQRFSSLQFIAALGDPNAPSGTGAQEWGIWRKDPGPRGVWLRDYNTVLESNNFVAPAGWKFDPQDWWVEEHGLIMESPQFPLPAGRYLVTGGRKVTTGLTVGTDGSWKLDEGTLFDVTHLPCRSARYHPTDPGTGSPTSARQSDFPVKPGAIMPTVPGTDKQDYAVLFLVGRGM